jgi:hypothetical protein
MQRWKIERFHYVLKSGCAIEKLQERSIDKTATLILMKEAVDYLGWLGDRNGRPAMGRRE